jgi:uncharacterized protein (DUF2147 family)
MIPGPNLKIAYRNTGIEFEKRDAVLGRWQHYKNEFDIEIFKSGLEYKARIVWLHKLLPNPAAKQERYNGSEIEIALQNRKIFETEMIKGLEFNEDADTWEGGTIFNPLNGRIRSVKIWLKGKEQMVMRSYWHFSCFGINTYFKRLIL